MEKKMVVFMLMGCLFATNSFAAAVDTVVKLPVIILPTKEASNMPLVLLITGDGGWKGFDPELANEFVKRGSPVVALNALRYFWKRKTPEQATQTVQYLIEKYMHLWHKQSFILTGYSYGADVFPFIINRLPSTLMKSCVGAAFFSPTSYIDFEVHVATMLGIKRKGDYNVIEEMKKMKPLKTLFFFGDKEHYFPVDELKRPEWKVYYLEGGHHYKETKKDLADMVIKGLGIGGE